MTRNRWAIWVMGAFVTFGVLEKRGLSQGHTLTACLRYWLGISPLHARRHVCRPIFGSLVLWFFAHILYGVPCPFDKNVRQSARIFRRTQARR